jgi:choline dehydrogenase
VHAHHPQPGLNGRDIAYPRGKAIGGSSAINAMLYLRGQAADYDGWRQLGLPGWGWDDVLPLFKGHEGHAGGATPFHNADGPLKVDYARASWEILDAWRDAAVTQGIPKTEDFNRGDNLGSSYFQLTQSGGLRCSAAKAFLKPVLHRPNLTLELNAHVQKLEMDRPAGDRRHLQGAGRPRHRPLPGRGDPLGRRGDEPANPRTVRHRSGRGVAAARRAGDQ